jgi:uncharacterized protein
VRVNPTRFYLALVLFHAGLLPVTVGLARIGERAIRRQLPVRDWLWLLVRGGALLGVVALGWAVLVTLAVLLPAYQPRASQLGSLLVRLLAQALFGEALLWLGWLTAVQARTGRPARSAMLVGITATLFAVYWRAYHVEPDTLRVRHHETRLGRGDAGTIRVLHMTDIQTPVIGPHEERAFREGLAQRPDLIVLTGDYIHERVGRRTAASAKRDLGALLSRLEFQAPLGVFATEGDAGLDCAEVFAGSRVECLVDEGRRVRLSGGVTLTIVGLSRRRSRERDLEVLRRLIDAAPAADYRLVIGHAPDFVGTVAGRLSVDLALAGHTHGGQVVLPLIGPLFTASRLPRRYAGDLHDYGGIPLHVSRGVGMERGMAPQIRFLCPPEICVLRVRYGAGAKASAHRES